MKSHQIGRVLEQRARAYLEGRGLKHLAENVRCRSGEIDLVMIDGKTVTFVEVRGRRGEGFGSASESVTRTKQTRLIRAAEYFLATRPELARYACRFDVVAIDLNDDPDRLEWIKDAFETQ